jgi:hypothetical protein
MNQELSTEQIIDPTAKLIKPVQLSQSFPPTSTHNQAFTSPVHEILATLNLDKIKKKDIQFRQNLTESDIPTLKLLHREWFPLDYDEKFYTRILDNTHSSLILELKITKNMLKKP